MRTFHFLPLLFIGCGPGENLVEGTVAGGGFDQVGTAFWGGRYMILVNQELDCLDMSFVNHTYTEGHDLGDQDFVALQFTFSRGTDAFPGNFSVQGAAEVNAKFLDYRDGIFDADDEYRGRDGVLVVEEVGDKDWAVGSFDIEFEDEHTLSGTYAMEWCINLPD